MPWLRKLKICHILMLTLAGIVNAFGTAGAYLRPADRDLRYRRHLS